MVIALPQISKRTFGPASSAPSEIAFSCAGLTATKLRNRLSSENVKAPNFLHTSEDVLQIGLSVSVFCRESNRLKYRSGSGSRNFAFNGSVTV